MIRAQKCIVPTSYYGFNNNINKLVQLACNVFIKANKPKSPLKLKRSNNETT